MLTAFINRLRCRMFGHLRGKRMLRVAMPVGTQNNVIGYQCPRCGATWTRKVKAKAAA
jgi:hypothetical protein